VRDVPGAARSGAGEASTSAAGAPGAGSGEPAPASRLRQAYAAAVELGERVFLRPPTARDRDELVKLAKASRKLHRPWVAPPDTPAAFDDWFRRVRSDRVESFLVCRREDAAIVGVYTLSEIVRGSFQSCYAGYYAHAGHAGNGYMREGLELLLVHVFRSLRLHRVEANIQPENNASVALVRGAGFRLEGLSKRYLKVGGRWRDHERWAITVEYWKERRGDRPRSLTRAAKDMPKSGGV
jgi:[ribosomal protein S5]-alanine N-acetyltransferase